MTANVQPIEEIEEFYSIPDPWKYDETPDDEVRLARFLACLPMIPYRRVLDIGCGNGFLTANLPGDQITGCDVSENAIGWARKRVSKQGTAKAFEFRASSIFDLKRSLCGLFDLVVITGLLYPQYIGNGFSVVREIVDSLLESEGILATAHIDDLCPWRFPYTLLNADLYQYREYTHRISIQIK